MLMDLSVKDFLSELASTSPAPGGGTIAALNGAMAAALGSMVCGLTIGNEKYPEAQNILPTAKELLEKLGMDFALLADEDTAAFNKVMAAYKLPKATEEEKTARRLAIQAANLEATNIPMKTAENAIAVAEALVQVARYGNQNAASDCGVALECAKAAATGALMNVSINLPSLKDTLLTEEYLKKKAELEKKMSYFYRCGMEEVEGKLSI